MRFLIPFALPLALVACAPPPPVCTDIAVAALNVTVEDAAGDPVCDAEVTARDGDFEEVLSVSGCQYFGAFERAGTYEITARRPGEIAIANDIVVDENECHVNAQDVAMTLEAVGCTEEVVAGLAITVVDENGANVCDAIVSAADGDHEELLESFGAGVDCTYSGAFERTGTYEIFVGKPGFELASLADVVVEEDFDGCHVVPQLREIPLGDAVDACTASIEPGLRVTFDTDGPCIATVSATDGDYSEDLELVNAGTCTFQGLDERLGQYQVTATAGDDSVSEVVIIQTDGCHPILEELTLSL